MTDRTPDEIAALNVDEPGSTTLVCQQCGAEYSAYNTRIRRGLTKYCSPKCSQSASRSVKGVHYKGQRYILDVHGYYISSTHGSKVRLHRQIWQDQHGPIPDNHVVHHKNGDKTDNRITNLEIMEWGEHTAHHNKTGVEMGIVVCIGCGIEVERRACDIRRGQNKYCSRICANNNRERNKRGQYG